MERVCAECRFFRVTEARPEGDIGKCRLEKVIGVFRDSMRACPSFSRQGETALPAPTPDRRRVAVTRRTEPAAAARSRVSPDRLAEVLQTLDPEALKAVMAFVLQGTQAMPVEELGRRWPGDLCLVPADESLKSKDVPLEQLFHKLVMVRDNLRVLEQKINSHTILHDAEKVDLQARLTRCQGAALTLGARWTPPVLPDGVDAEAYAALVALADEGEWDALALPAPVMGERWQGGRVRYGSDAGAVEEPIERFFHRLVVLRDRLMGLEAVVSAHPHVGRDDSAQIAGYIRRCFGSLTTFNLLFRDRADYFTSGR